MTLGKGNHLIKATPYEPDSRFGSFADRVRSWAAEHPEGEITERDLAQILCPNESYVIHEVMEDVHYTSGKFWREVQGDDRAQPVSHVEGVTLKVVY